MHMNRRKPQPGEDIALFLSGVVNDAIRDAREHGLSASEIWIMLTRYARGADPVGLNRVYSATVLDHRLKFKGDA